MNAMFSHRRALRSKSTQSQTLFFSECVNLSELVNVSEGVYFLRAAAKVDQVSRRSVFSIWSIHNQCRTGVFRALKRTLLLRLFHLRRIQ